MTAVDTHRASQNGETLAVALVSTVAMNPYVELLRGALDAVPGVEARTQKELTPGWVWRQRRRLDVIHLHWLELQIASPSRYRAAKKFLRLILALALARLAGIAVVYTVHNIEQHEGQRARLNRWANRWIFRTADAVHVHDACVADEVAARFGRARGIYVVPHGNYVGAYPAHSSREEARQWLGLGASDVGFLFLGQIRPYKGIEELIAAFRRLVDVDCALIVAGHPQDQDYADEIAQMAKSDERIHLRLGYVPDQDVHRYMLACDVCVLPYRQVTTSGAALLAFSFGLPIVAPRMGCFEDLVGEKRGVLYDAGAPHGLEQAMRRAAQLGRAAVRREVLEYTRSLGWEHLAPKHVAAYRRAQRRRR